MNNADKPVNSGQARGINGEFIDEYNVGITLREHFAGLAMQALLASNVRTSMENFANRAVSMADKLLKELER